MIWLNVKSSCIQMLIVRWIKTSDLPDNHDEYHHDEYHDE